VEALARQPPGEVTHRRATAPRQGAKSGCGKSRPPFGSRLGPEVLTASGSVCSWRLSRAHLAQRL
jgi:hypothetical protein